MSAISRDELERVVDELLTDRAQDRATIRRLAQTVRDYQETVKALRAAGDERTKPPTVGDVARGQHQPPHSKPPLDLWTRPNTPSGHFRPQGRLTRLVWRLTGRGPFGERSEN